VVTYKAAVTDTTASLVTVKSLADATGVTVTISETGVNTGIFESNMALCSTGGCSSATTTPPQLLVADTDTVTLTYADASNVTVSTTVKVETQKPAASGITPANDFATQNTRPVLRADVTDTDSGLLKTNISLAVQSPGGGSTEGILVPDDTGITTTISGGFQVEQRITPSLAPVADNVINWWVVSTDGAGNVLVSDQTTTSTCTPTLPVTTSNISTLATNGCQPYVINVDFTSPALVSARTGDVYDATNDEIDTGASGSSTSVRVIFNEDLDASSVTGADFLVGGVQPSSATVTASTTGVADLQRSVFLTMTTAQVANVAPTVQLVSGIADKAGNTLSTGSLTASDGIAPSLTVTLIGEAASRAVSDAATAVTIRVSSDEDVTTPTLAVKAVGNSGVLGSAVSCSLSVVAARTWESACIPGAAGLYNVYLSSQDIGPNSNASTAGSETDYTATTAIVFEVDAGIQNPTVIPASAGTTEFTDPFVSLNFVNEGLEYGLDSGSAVTTTPASVVTDFDKHGTVTLSAASLDGTDVLSSFVTEDNIIYVMKTSGLALGAHTVKVSATDQVGNALTDFSWTFTVVERALTQISLKPGVNLISLPGQPSDSGIDAVFANSPDVTSVVTYDAAAGEFLVAVRDGTFAGNLTSIGAGRAYWVTTSSFAPIKVAIPLAQAGASTLPLTIDLVSGWNLVPVIDVTGAGTDPAASAYFSSISAKILKVYTFNTLSNLWVAVDVASGGDNVSIGSGYWVFLSAAGTLVP